MTKHVTLMVAAALGLSGAACDQSNQQPQAQAPVAEAPPSSGAGSGAPSSSLGGAKRSAERTVDKVEQRQQDILKQIEDPKDD